MTRTSFRIATVLFASLPIAVAAQQRGRTDGPEGSEYGKGGYQSLGGGRFSLQLHGGAALPQGDTPLFAGLGISYWWNDWFLLDIDGLYAANLKAAEVLLGPRFRTATYPVSAYVGLKAGPMIFTSIPGQSTTVRFGLSPEAGFDFLLEKWLFGLGYAVDFPLGIDSPINVQTTPGKTTSVSLPSHRIFLTVGYRF